MVEPESAVIEALSHADQVDMATLALGGWTFQVHHIYGGKHKWKATPGWVTPFKGAFYAASLSAVLAYIRDQYEILPDGAKTRPGAPRKN